MVAKFVADYEWSGPVFAISALEGTGCTALTYALMDYLGAQAPRVAEEPEAVIPAPAD